MEEDPEKGLFARFLSLLKKKNPIGNSSDLAEEIHDLMDEGQARGFVSDEETHMVNGVLELKQTQVHSIMIPRTEISSAPLDSTLSQFIGLVTDCGHTRIPIYEKGLDKIVGILHAKDILRLWGKDSGSKIPFDNLRKPFFVPTTKKAIELLKDLKEKKMHLAIVTDEYGGTAGIITIEDILEEIVGEIQYEHDNEQSLLKVMDERSVLVDARLEIEKLEEHLNAHFPKGDFESVGGFIIHLLGRIPRTNEKISFEDLELIIKKADQRKIDSVLITRTSPPESAGTQTHR